MSIFSKILGLGTSEILNGMNSIIGKFKIEPAEKESFKLQLESLLQKCDQEIENTYRAEIEAKSDIIYADRQQEDPKEFEPGADNNNEQLGIVTANKLNVRATPSTTSSKVTEPLTKGSLVKITEQHGNWYKVKIEEEGWVSREWVRI